MPFPWHLPPIGWHPFGPKECPKGESFAADSPGPRIVQGFAQPVRAQEQFLQASIELYLLNFNKSIYLYKDCLAIWEAIEPTALGAACARFQMAYAQSLTDIAGAEECFKECLAFCDIIVAARNRQQEQASVAGESSLCLGAVPVDRQCGCPKGGGNQGL